MLHVRWESAARTIRFHFWRSQDGRIRESERFASPKSLHMAAIMLTMCKPARDRSDLRSAPRLARFLIAKK